MYVYIYPTRRGAAIPPPRLAKKTKKCNSKNHQESIKNQSKINQKRTKNLSKIAQNRGLEASWRRLGGVLGGLGASWKHFGVSWEV